jgi:probable HAF family extracellular repeat protein
VKPSNLIALVVLFAVCACAVAQPVPSTPPVAIAYSIRDLGALPLGHSLSRGAALNDNADVTGWSTTREGPYAAFRWRSGELDRLAVPGGAGSFGLCLDGNGRIGGYTLKDGEQRGALWTAGTYQDVNAAIRGAPEVLQRVVALNTKRQMLVTTWPYLIPRAKTFVWNGSVLTDVGSLSSGAIGAAMNELGEVAGESRTADGRTSAFFWSAGKMVDLGAVAGSPRASAATALNNNGVVVGWITGPDGPRATVWIRDGRGAWSAQPVDREYAAYRSMARGVNDDGLIVGEVSLPGSAWYATSAFVSQTGGGLRILADALSDGRSWGELTTAVAINAHGEILANAVRADGLNRAALIAPVQESTIEVSHYSVSAGQIGAPANYARYGAGAQIRVRGGEKAYVEVLVEARTQSKRPMRMTFSWLSPDGERPIERFPAKVYPFGRQRSANLYGGVLLYGLAPGNYTLVTTIIDYHGGVATYHAPVMVTVR